MRRLAPPRRSLGRLATTCGLLLVLLVACVPAIEQPKPVPSAYSRGTSSGFLTPADRAALLALAEEAL